MLHSSHLPPSTTAHVWLSSMSRDARLTAIDTVTTFSFCSTPCTALCFSSSFRFLSISVPQQAEVPRFPEEDDPLEPAPWSLPLPRSVQDSVAHHPRYDPAQDPPWTGCPAPPQGWLHLYERVSPSRVVLCSARLWMMMMHMSPMTMYTCCMMYLPVTVVALSRRVTRRATSSLHLFILTPFSELSTVLTHFRRSSRVSRRSISTASAW